MPELAQPQTPPNINLDLLPFKLSSDKLTNDEAINLVVDNFNQCESDRSRNYDWKWLDSDSLYNGVVERRKWTGTDKWRSAIPNNISFDHVESAQASIESILFDNPEYFAVEAMRESSPQDALDVEEVLMDMLEKPDEEDYSTGRREMRSSIKSGLMYGTGMAFLEWTGKSIKVMDIDIHNVYLPSRTKTPCVDHCTCVIVRDEMTVDQLEKFRNSPKIDLPSAPLLYWMTQTNPVPMSAQMEQMRALTQGVATSTSSVLNDAPNPADRKIEVLRYYDKGRIIWILGRMHVMYMDRNPYGVIPLVSFPCRLNVGQFYGSSLPEAIRWQQRYTEALYNGHIDELHLALDPPTVGPKDAKPNDLRTYPGNYSTVSDPKQVIRQKPPNATVNVLQDVSYMEQMAERRNGLSSMLQGAARPGNINRTRAGVLAQSEGSNLRLKHIVENFQDYYLLPLLQKMVRMIQVHTSPDQILLLSAPGPNGERYRPITAAPFHKPMRFRIEAATRMITRERLGSVLDPVLRMLMSIAGGLAEQGETLDASEIAKTIQDAAGLPKRYTWVKKMTPEQQQARNQPPPEAVMRQQDKQADLSARMNIAQMKNQSEMAGHQAEIQKAVIQKQPSPEESQMKMMEMNAKVAQQQQQAQLKQQEMEGKLRYQQAESQQKLAFLYEQGRIKAQESEEKLRQQQQQSQLKAQQGQVDAQASVMEHAMSLQMMREQREETRRQNAADEAAKPKPTTKPKSNK